MKKIIKRREGMREYVIEDKADRKFAEFIRTTKMDPLLTIPSIDTLVKAMRKIKSEIKVIEAKHEAELDKYKKVKDKLEGLIIDHLRKTKQLSAKTEFGTASRYIRRSFSIEDQSEFRRHVLGTESWELISWGHVMSTAAKDFEEKNNSLPPGVKDSKLEVLSITAPPKPKTKVATAEGGKDDMVNEQQMEEETL